MHPSVSTDKHSKQKGNANTVRLESTRSFPAIEAFLSSVTSAPKSKSNEFYLYRGIIIIIIAFDLNFSQRPLIFCLLDCPGEIGSFYFKVSIL